MIVIGQEGLQNKGFGGWMVSLFGSYKEWWFLFAVSGEFFLQDSF